MSPNFIPIAMSRSISPNQPTGPLSVGNIVSAGLRVYRDHFKLYYGLAFIAYLWVLVPVYGWAKYSMISGLISRLAFGEISERPETLQDARRHVKPRMWNFLVAGLLVGLILLATTIAAAFVIGILAAIIGTLIGLNESAFLSAILLVSIALFVFLFGYVWLYSRLSLPEFPLAIESQTGDATSAISRSWNLTKGFVLRLQLIFIVAFLIALPISVVVQIATNFIQEFFATIVSSDSIIFAFLSLIFSLPLSIAGGALLLPFWQSVKAAIYYDLRSRKEGFGLDIRDAKSDEFSD